MKHTLTKHSLPCLLVLSVLLSCLLPAAAAGEENIALGKRAVACHTESPSLSPSCAVDGRENTRFAAGGVCTHDTWFVLDLGDIYDVSRVSILWETAHPTRYTLELSEDGTNFTAVKAVTADASGTVRADTALTGTGRFLRIAEQARSAPAYGFSIYELQVRGHKNPDRSDTSAYVTVSAEDCDYGSLRVSPSGFVRKGDTVTVEAVPAAGCTVESIKIGQEKLTMKNNTASFTADTDCTVTASFRQGQKSRFECEDVPVYADSAARNKLSMSRGADAAASGGYVAGNTGGRWFLFENVCEANCIHIAYASPNTNSMRLCIRYPGEESFTAVGTIPFSTSNSWYMDSSYTASSSVMYIPAGSDLLISPNADCNLDYLYLTNDVTDAAPDKNTLTAAQMSDRAVTDSVSPFGKVLSVTGEASVELTVPDAQASYNVFSITVSSACGGTFRLERGGTVIGSGELPAAQHRAFVGTGIRIGTVTPGETVRLTVTSGGGELLLSHVVFNAADEPEAVTVPALPAQTERLTVSLDGIWAVTAEAFGEWSVPDTVPGSLQFTNSIPVPGLWHSASFDLGSYASHKMWLQKTVILSEEPTGTVLLDIGAAQYGRYIYVNGQYAGEYVYNYSRSLTDISGLLHKGENTVTVMLGDWAQQFNDKTTAAHVLNDGESTTNKPGITDCVSLIFTAAPDVVSVQTAQNIDRGTVAAQTVLSNRTNADITTDVTFTVYELGLCTNGVYDRAETKVGEFTVKNRTVKANSTLTVSADRIQLSDWTREKCWSPDSPFLYRIEVSTCGDTFSARFGMRTFSFDGQGNARLNGEIICLMGTNVAIERFFDDPLCLTNPWDSDWVCKLYTEYRDCNWFCFRTHLGSANSVWFDLADEMGFMIFDEYANWGDSDGCTADSIMPEIYNWIDTRGHHPSLIVFDAMNEGGGTLSDSIIRLGREYDIQHRPWDNGWNRPIGETDSVECHPYVMGGRGISALQDFDNEKPLVTTADIGWTAEQFASHPFILNEHGELWISREGQSMSGTAGFWASLRANTSNEARNTYYADAMAAEIECFRAGRAYTGILFFCGLGSSPAGAIGVTSDILSPDVSTPESLCIRPYIKERLTDAFSPLGICIDYYTEEQRRDTAVTLPVVLINDTGTPVDGLQLVLKVMAGDTVLYADRATVSVPVHTEDNAGLGTAEFRLRVPAYRDLCANRQELTVSVSYELNGQTVSSVRKWYLTGGSFTDDEIPTYDWLETQTSAETEPAEPDTAEPGTDAPAQPDETDTLPPAETARPAATDTVSEDTAPAPAGGCASAVGACVLPLCAAAGAACRKRVRRKKTD